MAQLDNCYKNILRGPMPQGNFGRNLTAAEVRDLKVCGVHATRNWIVIRKIFDVATIGLLYSPAKNGGYNSESVEIL